MQLINQKITQLILSFTGENTVRIQSLWGVVHSVVLFSTAPESSTGPLGTYSMCVIWWYVGYTSIKQTKEIFIGIVFLALVICVQFQTNTNVNVANVTRNVTNGEDRCGRAHRYKSL